MSLNEQGVVVAILCDGYHLQEMTAFLTLGPQAVFGTAEKGHPTQLVGFFQGGFVHKAQHEYFPGGGVLYDGRYQAVQLAIIQGHDRSIFYG
jgi:hypothetical protein